MLRLNHKQLDVWKASVDIVKEVYQLTQSFPKDELYGITSQLKRSSVSIVSNLEIISKIQIDTRRFLQI
jgi:four helix bundle protein